MTIENSGSRRRAIHPDALDASETSERNIFQRSTALAARQLRAMNALAIIDVVSVTRMELAGSDKVRTQRVFLVHHKPIESAPPDNGQRLTL